MEEQQDLPGVKPGLAPQILSTLSPLPSWLRFGQTLEVHANFAFKALSAAAGGGGSGRGAPQGFQGFQGVTGLGPAAARFVFPFQKCEIIITFVYKPQV